MEEWPYIPHLFLITIIIPSVFFQKVQCERIKQEDNIRIRNKSQIINDRSKKAATKMWRSIRQELERIIYHTFYNTIPSLVELGCCLDSNRQFLYPYWKSNQGNTIFVWCPMEKRHGTPYCIQRERKNIFSCCRLLWNYSFTKCPRTYMHIRNDTTTHARSFMLIYTSELSINQKQ